MAIVTISYQLGSGGREVAQAVADRLEYRLVGDDMLAEAAAAHGLAEDKLIQAGEAKPPLRDRLDAGAQVYVAVIQAAVYDAAQQDRVVLLGRGGQWLLRGMTHVLRVRVIAPLEVRVQRVAERLSMRAGQAANPRAALEAAADLVRRDDRDKTGRMRYLYEQDIDDPRLYDVIVNTEKSDLDGVADFLATFTRRPGLATTEEATRRLADRVLAARVQVALVSHPEARTYRYLSVQAQDGVVRISTMGPTALVEEVARGVPGVVRVVTDEPPLLPPFPVV